MSATSNRYRRGMGARSKRWRKGIFDAGQANAHGLPIASRGGVLSATRALNFVPALCPEAKFYLSRDPVSRQHRASGEHKLPINLPIGRDDMLIIASAVATIAAAITAVRVDHNLATVATAGGAVWTALIGYQKARRAERNALDVANVGAKASLDTNARTVLVQTVTSERAVWRREMRSAAAELATVLCEANPKPDRDWTRVDRLGSEIRLRLNPKGRALASATGRHAQDHAVHVALDTICGIDRMAAGVHTDSADELEKAVADLLKQEWTKSKREAVTGRLEDADGADGDPDPVAAA